MSTSRLVELDESPPRARRPADAVKVIGGAVLVGWGVLSVDVQTAWERALAGLVTELPPWIRSIFAVGSVLGLLYGVGVVLVIVLHRRTRPGAVRDVVVAVLLGAGLAAILARVTTGSWPDLTGLFALDDPTRQFPVLRVVVVTSILVAASPHLSRPMRRTGWLMIAATAIAAVGLGYAHPSDAVGGLGVGLIAGGAVLLVAGSPRGYPNPAAVADALRRMGLSIEEVWIEPEQSWGVRRLGATTAEGDALAIKAYGRDASDSQLMAKAWRALWYREDGRSVSYSRLRAVEHEALVTMFAGRAGARVPEVVAAGQASAEIALLVVSAGGRRLDAFDAADVSDEDVTAVWRDVGRLHASAVSHGSLSAGAIAFDGSGHTIGDFGLGSVVADESDRCLDTVELLFSLSPLIGAERAARTAHAGLGNEALTAVLPYLQLPAVSAGARRSAERSEACDRGTAASGGGGHGRGAPGAGEVASGLAAQSRHGRVARFDGLGVDPGPHRRRLRRGVVGAEGCRLGSDVPRPPPRADDVHPRGHRDDVRRSQRAPVLAGGDAADRHQVHRSGRPQHGGPDRHERRLPPQVRAVDRHRRHPGRHRRVLRLRSPGRHPRPGPAHRRRRPRPRSNRRRRRMGLHPAGRPSHRDRRRHSRHPHRPAAGPPGPHRPRWVGCHGRRVEGAEPGAGVAGKQRRRQPGHGGHPVPHSVGHACADRLRAGARRRRRHLTPPGTGPHPWRYRRHRSRHDRLPGGAGGRRIRGLRRHQSATGASPSTCRRSRASSPCAGWSGTSTSERPVEA